MIQAVMQWLHPCPHHWVIPVSEFFGPAPYKLCKDCGREELVSEKDRPNLPRMLVD